MNFQMHRWLHRPTDESTGYQNVLCIRVTTRAMHHKDCHKGYIPTTLRRSSVNPATLQAFMMSFVDQVPKRTKTCKIQKVHALDIHLSK